MLRTRILTAAVALPLAVAGILWLPNAAVAAILGFVLAVGAWEWARLIGLQAVGVRGTYTVLAALLFGLLWLNTHPTVAVGVPWLAMLWWLLAALLVARFPRGWDVSVGQIPLSAGLGLLILGAAFDALVRLHVSGPGPALMLFVFVLVWAADTGAYFAGHALGRRKLAPRVSPGKTWEGAGGGIVAAALVSAAAAWYFGYWPSGAASFVVLAAISAVFSIVGDLTLSMFKRQAGLKDSGTLFPGHGGVLDRLDSVLAAAPCFFFCFTYLL